MAYKQVVIVGGGISGIAAATRLYEAGCTNIVILEAENRIGGRINTVPFEGANVELGAQWVHGERGNVVYELAHPLGLLNSEVFFDLKKMKYVDSKSNEIAQHVANKYISVIESIRHSDLDYFENSKEQDTKSLGELFAAKFEALTKSECIDTSEEVRKQFLEFFHKFQKSIDGSDSWFDVSKSTISEYEECLGNSVISWNGKGYKSLLQILMERCKDKGDFEKENILLNHEVCNIEWNDEKVTVTCTNGKKFISNGVILTVSLGVLKEQLNSWFSTPLPDGIVLAINNLGIGTVDKMYLSFDEVWWPRDIVGFNFLWTEEDKKFYVDAGKGWLTDIFGFYRVENTENILCGWIVGESARIMEKMDEEKVLHEVTLLLVKFLGTMYALSNPTNFVRSMWYTNKHFRGSYSYRSVSSSKYDVECLQKGITRGSSTKPLILFAGEATHQKFYSSVHGAVMSGYSAALKIMKQE